MEEPRATTNSQNSPSLELGGSHHLSFIVYFMSRHGTSTEMSFCPRTHKWESVVTPLWPSVGVKPNTPKVEDLESSGTPECSEFDSRGQNTSNWDVLSVVGKVSKRRCRKWPRIGHLDICSPSYGQKKGRESNWQFHSRPLKV
jgi:hypothetical protein